MIYLASPYTNDDPAIRHQRFLDVCLAASMMMKQGDLIFSPISHTHPIAQVGDLPKGWDYWKNYDSWFIERCDLVRVLMLDGWQQSKGIAAEIELAIEFGKSVEYWGFDGVKTWQVKSYIFRSTASALGTCKHRLLRTGWKQIAGPEPTMERVEAVKFLQWAFNSPRMPGVVLKYRRWSISSLEPVGCPVSSVVA